MFQTRPSLSPSARQDTEGFPCKRVLMKTISLLLLRPSSIIETRMGLTARFFSVWIKKIPYERAIKAGTTHEHDYIKSYVEDLENIIDMDAIRSANLRIGADAMGGAGLAFWGPIAEKYGLNIEVKNRHADPTFRFMTVDKDGRIRMDCYSPCAMASLIDMRDQYDIAFGNAPDFDRHGIVTPGYGLMNPNHYLSAAIWYLFRNRDGWRSDAAVGKTLVSSSMIDRIAKHLGRRLSEVPVGFKWFVDGLLD